MIDPKDVTPGYWYVLRNVIWMDDDQRLYEIVDVKEDGMLKYCGVDEHLSCDKYHPSVFFIAPVPDLISKPEETIKDLKKQLGLPNSATTSEMFRAALKVAKDAIKERRSDE